jgi:hypothetical protein
MANPTDFQKEELSSATMAQIDAFGARLHNQFSINESFRFQKEQEWLQSQRQHAGVYDPEVENKLDQKRSRVYPKITRSKNISVEARLHDICFPDTGKNWGIDPSPDSTIPDFAMQKVMEDLMREEAQKVMETVKQQQQQNPAVEIPMPESIPLPSEEKVQLRIQQFAKKACQKMEIEIADQLLDTKYEDCVKKALRSGLYLGTGLIKGPLVEMAELKRWILDPVRQQYALDTRQVPRPYLEFVRVWDIYPDMSVTEFDQAEGIFQRHVMTKHEVPALSKREDFFGNRILGYLRSNPEGDCDFKNWEIELQQISKDSNVTELRKGRKYEVLEYWGYVDARDLISAGVTIEGITEDREDIEFEAQVWLLGNIVIKATLNQVPKARRPYHVFYFEKDDSNIFGNSLAKVIRDTQITICAAARMILDNGAICAGPQLELNTDLLDLTAQDATEVSPFKEWFRSGMGVDAQYPAVRTISMDSHTAEYLSIIKQWMEFGDLETAFPTYMLIEPQKMGNETAQGASLRFGSVNITVKDVAKNFDDFNAGIIEGMYEWNMEFSEKQEVKGDYRVKSKGYTSLIAKEVRAQALQNINQTLTDEDRGWIKRREYLSEIWKALDLPQDVLRTEEEYREYIEQTADPRMMELQLEHLAAEIQKLRALSLSNVAGAKLKNLEAAQIAAGQGQEPEKKEKAA